MGWLTGAFTSRGYARRDSRLGPRDGVEPALSSPSLRTPADATALGHLSSPFVLSTQRGQQTLGAGCSVLPALISYPGRRDRRRRHRKGSANSVNTEHHDTMDGKGVQETNENVVRLPREWIGPREKLVPMGSRAGAGRPTPLDGLSDRSIDDDDRSDDVTEELAPAAGDFWTAGASAVHHAIQGPTPRASSTASEPGPSEPRIHDEHPASDRARRRRLLPRGPRTRRAWGYRPQRTAAGDHRSPRPLTGPGQRRRPRWTTFVGALAGACLVATTVIGLSEHGRSTATRSRTHAIAASGGPVHQLDPHAGVQRSAAPSSRTAQRVSSTHRRPHRSKPAHHRSTRPRRTRTHHRGASTHHATSSSVGSSSVGTTSSSGTSPPTTAAPTTPTTATPTAPTTTAAPVSTTPASTPTTASSSSTGGSSSSPSHRPAYGEGGVLGAGHSSGSS